MAEHHCGCEVDGPGCDNEDCCEASGGHCDSIEREPECDQATRHEWSSEGEGGCDENPGVWSLGGTTLTFAAHCTRCGLRRHETHYGSQRNPYQCDEVRYEVANG
jgi:hypothetical protein